MTNWAYLRNCGSHTYEINLLTIYYDAAKIPLETTAKEVAQYQSNSTQSDAKIFFIEVWRGYKCRTS